MSKKRGQNKMVANQCEICGKTFYASRASRHCVENSTCRVKAHQQKKQVDAIAKTLMLDFDSYGIYCGFVKRFPSMQRAIDTIIIEQGIPRAMKTIGLLWEIVALREAEGVTEKTD